MALDYISERITREEFFEKIYSKSGSESALETAKAHLQRHTLFVQLNILEFADFFQPKTS